MSMSAELTEFAAFIGIDWADRKHDVCLQAAGASKREMSARRRQKLTRTWRKGVGLGQNATWSTSPSRSWCIPNTSLVIPLPFLTRHMMDTFSR